MSFFHSPLLDGLAAVIAEAEVHGALDGHGIEHAVDGLGGQIGVLGVAGDIGLVDLHAGAGQFAHLLGEDIGQHEGEPLEIAVMFIEQRAGEHVGAGDGELERPRRDRCGEGRNPPGD